MPKYDVGDLATLAFPKKLENIYLRGEEVEIVKIISKLNSMYQVKVTRTGEDHIASEKQLMPLEPSNTPSNWEHSAWIPAEKRKS